MQPENAELNPAETSGSSPPATHDIQREREIAQETLDIFTKTRPRRTAGLHIFDWTVYSLNNFLVFAVSVGLTYLTMRGGPDETGKLPFGKIGKGIHDRGGIFLKYADRWFGLRGQSADAAKMVFFSFADGSAFAIMVKLLENKREVIAKWIDERLGTVHPDETVYEAEPHQTWKSVAAGRALTAGIVLPVAMALDKIHYKGSTLNEKFFYNPGAWAGRKAAKKPQIAKYFGKKLDPEVLTSVGLFELFYTTICTFGLYFSSRFVARIWETDKKKKEVVAELKSFTTNDNPIYGSDSQTKADDSKVVANVISTNANDNGLSAPHDKIGVGQTPVTPVSSVAHIASHGRIGDAAQHLVPTQ